MTAWTFTVPRALPSRNENARRHHWAVKKALAVWAADIRNTMTGLHIPVATGPRRLTITRLLGKGQKFYDPDNVDTKTLIDAMKVEHARRPMAGLIVNDSPAWLVLMPTGQERAADGRAATRITIEDIEPEGVL